jgi:hypothetical protein
LTLIAVDAELLRLVLRFAGRTSATNLAMACSSVFGSGLMPRPTIVNDVFAADALAAYFDDAVVPYARIEEAGLTALTRRKPELSRRQWVHHCFGPLCLRGCRAVGHHLISEGLHSWAFRVEGLSHVRFGVLRIPEEYEQHRGFIDCSDSAEWLSFVELFHHMDWKLILTLTLDMDERDLRLFSSFFGEGRKPFLSRSIANLPCGPYKLVVELVPRRFEQGYLKLLGKDPPLI